jgi:hypothetical protein
LSEHNLHEDACVDIIKLYAAVAQKEFAIKCTLDQIDSDVMNLPLTMKPYQDSGAYIFDKVDSDLIMLRDCEMKIATIATNVYSKYYENRVSMLGKEIKYILEFYKSWKVLTKDYAYLMPIFN